jgi:hypothetical protein
VRIVVRRKGAFTVGENEKAHAGDGGRRGWRAGGEGQHGSDKEEGRGGKAETPSAPPTSAPASSALAPSATAAPPAAAAAATAAEHPKLTAMETALETLEVSVVDTGPGIAPADVPKLFKKYEQMGFHKGTGLGLVVTQLIARLMGTEVRVQSPWQEGHSGCKFWMTLHAPTCEAGNAGAGAFGAGAGAVGRSSPRGGAGGISPSAPRHGLASALGGGGGGGGGGGRGLSPSLPRDILVDVEQQRREAECQAAKEESRLLTQLQLLHVEDEQLNRMIMLSKVVSGCTRS